MSQPATDRTLPHNLEAERAVLGAIIVHNDALETVGASLAASSFYRDSHRRIFAAILRLQAQRVAVDFVTLKEALARSGDLDAAGGPAYIASLTDGVPRSTNVRHYCGIVAEKAALRDLVYAANAMLTAAYEADRPASVIVSEADRALLALHGHGTSHMRSMAETSSSRFAELEWRVAHKGELRGVTTGYQSINDLTLGLREGDLDIVAARPSIGKSTLALNIAVHASRAGARVAVFSLEMTRTQLEDRILAQLSRVALSRIQSGHIGAQDWTPLSEAIEAMSALAIGIDDRSGQTASDVRHGCRTLIAEYGSVNLVIVDYVQLMPGQLARKGASRTEELSDTAMRLKDLAKELSVPVLLLSQLRRHEGRPKIEDLRECLPGTAVIIDATTGARLSVTEIAAREEPTMVSALNERGRLEPRAVSRIWAVGEKPILRIVSASGRVLECSSEHEVLTDDGYTPASAVRAGSWVALNRRQPSPLVGRHDISGDQALLLGWMLGDGYCGGTPALTVCCREDAIKAVRLGRIAFGLNPSVKEERRTSRAWRVSFTTGFLCGATKNPFTQWLRRYGVWQVTGTKKAIPLDIWECDDATLAAVLRGLYHADGSLAQRHGTTVDVRFTNISESLARGVHELLRRFGIIATIRRDRQRATPSYGTPSGWIWTVAIHAREDIQVFMRLIGFLGWKQRRALRRVTPKLSNSGRHMDTLPPFANAYIKSLGLSHERVGWRNQGKSMTRETARRIGTRLGDDRVMAWATSDIFWDRVATVESIGSQPCYDLTVDGLHNVCVDGFMTHNCGALEQIADCVGLLHRKDHRMSGTTEFALAKQRNGPTGTVNLTLDRDTTTFTDGGEPIPEPTQEERTQSRKRSFARRFANAEG